MKTLAYMARHETHKMSLGKWLTGDACSRMRRECEANYLSERVR